MSSTSHATVQGNFLEAQALQPGYHAQVLVLLLAYQVILEKLLSHSSSVFSAMK